MALALNALVSVNTVKQFYPTITNNFDDTDIEFLIDSVSDIIEEYCDRKLVKTEKTDLLTGNCKRRIKLSERPIISLGEILQNDINITDNVVEETTEDELEGGFIYYDEGFISGRRKLKVRFTYGYVTENTATEEEPETLPRGLKGIVLKMISKFADEILSENGNIKAEGSNSASRLKTFAITDVKWQFGKDIATGERTSRTAEDVALAFLTKPEQEVLNRYIKRSL